MVPVSPGLTLFVFKFVHTYSLKLQITWKSIEYKTGLPTIPDTQSWMSSQGATLVFYFCCCCHCFRFIYFFILCIWVFCLHVCVCIPWVSGACSVQKTSLDPQGLALQTKILVHRTEPGSSARTPNALNRWAISLTNLFVCLLVLISSLKQLSQDWLGYNTANLIQNASSWIK